MEQKQVNLETIYSAIQSLRQEMHEVKTEVHEVKEMHIQLDDEGELTEEAKERIEKARKTPISQYISHEEVKKKILAKK